MNIARHMANRAALLSVWCERIGPRIDAARDVGADELQRLVEARWRLNRLRADAVAWVARLEAVR